MANTRVFDHKSDTFRNENSPMFSSNQFNLECNVNTNENDNYMKIPICDKLSYSWQVYISSFMSKDKYLFGREPGRKVIS